MRYLIDTHVLIWYINGDDALPQKNVDLIFDPQNELFISMASFWELAIKMSSKNLRLKIGFQEIVKYFTERDFVILNVSFDHLKTLLSLPTLHGDPFDRIIISQAISDDLTIISADRQFKAYPAQVIW